QELQADCFAGVWGHAAGNYRDMLEPGDLEEALQAAAAIGDDRLQKRSGGEVVPDSFTHGTSAQRVEWFRRGFESGDMAQAGTFSSQRGRVRERACAQETAPAGGSRRLVWVEPAGFEPASVSPPLSVLHA